MGELQYVTRMEPRFAALEVVDVPAVAGAVTDEWYNETLCQVSDSLVRLGVVRGEYHWHRHDGEDEFFYVVEGRLTIEVEGRPAIELAPGQGVTIPQGLMHRPIANERTVILMIERAGVTPTGD